MILKKITTCILTILLSILLSGQAQLNPILQDSINNEEWVDHLNERSRELLFSAPQTSLDYINQAIRLADSLDYQYGLYIATINKGSRFWMSGLYDQALKYYYQAEKLGQKNPGYDQARIYNNMAESFKQLNNFDSADLYLQKAIALVNKISGDKPPSMITYNRGELFYLKNEKDSASRLFRQSLAMAKKDNNLRVMAYAMTGLSKIAFENGEWKSAISQAEAALKARLEQNDTRAIVLSYLTLSKYLKVVGNDILAESYLDKAIKLSRNMKAYDLLGQCLYEAFQHYYDEKRFKEASNYLNDYTKLTDSISTANANDRITSIRSALEAELQNTEIQLLREQQNRQKQTVRTQILIIVFSALLVLALVIIVYYYAQNLRKEKKHSGELNQLNQTIKSKNAKIEEMNRKLDLELSTTSQMLIDGQKTANLGSWEYHIKENKLDWTDETFRQLNMHRNEVVPSIELLKDIVGLEQFEQLEVAFQKSIDSKKEQRLELIIPAKKPESNKVLSVNFIPQFSNGEAIRVYGSNHDITHRFQQEKQERKIIQSLLELSKHTSLRKQTFENFINQLLISGSNTLQVDRASFWIYSQEKRHIKCYKLFKQSTQSLESGDVLTEKDYPIYFNALRAERTLDAHDIITDPRTCEFVSRYIKDTGVKAMLDAKVMVDGKMVGVICFEKTTKSEAWTLSDQRYVGSLTDIIANAYANYLNKKLENEKVGLINELMLKNQNLQQFAYVISHNLRGPATQIIGLSELYKTSEDRTEEKEIIEKIREAADSLDEVIQDLSILVGSEDGELKNQSYETILLSDVMNKVSLQLKSEINRYKAVIEQEFEDEYSIEIHTKTLIDVIKELMLNSLKYSKSDQIPIIKIAARTEYDQYILQISDNGRGLDLNKYGHKLFKTYQRFHLEIPGRGIGLYLVKNQVEQLGGQIDFKSEPGVGSVITLTFPSRQISSDIPD